MKPIPFALLLIAAAVHAAPLRVACVGDSITYGLGLADREREAYPAVLARMLGPSATVGNFGVSGACALRSGALPYWQTGELERIARFEPDAIVLMLGTNDARPENAKARRDFTRDLHALIERLRAPPSNPRIWVCLPPPIFGVWRAPSAKTLTNHILPAIREAAAEAGAEIVDVWGALEGRADLFPDGLHPNAEGARIIAETVFQSLTEPPVGPVPESY